MSNNVSAANTSNLETFVTEAGGATSSLADRYSTAKGSVSAFFDAPCAGEFRPAGDNSAFAQVQTLITDDQIDERWIAGIRNAFLQADENSGMPSSGVSYALNSTIGQSLKSQGIDPNAPTAITQDEPVYAGVQMMSGWSDDPVSTTAGHFLEVEQDIVMPSTLRHLSVTRTYTSRFLRSEGFGPGWYSWASTRLEVATDEIVYQGPDGQAAPFAYLHGVLRRHPGMDADLTETADGYVLIWDPGSKFSDMSWIFDHAGQLTALHDPQAGEVTATHRDGHLVELAHSGGRTVRLDWDGEHIVAATSSDGRRAEYHYDAAGFLLGVDGPRGARRYTADPGGRIAEVFDADGVREVSNTYDLAGRVTAQESALGRVSTYRYIAPSSVLVADRDGGPSTLFRHDAAGRLTELQLGDGSRLERDLDPAGNPVRVREFDGSVTERHFDGLGRCVVETRDGASRSFAYDDAGRVVRLTDRLGAETCFEYEGDNLRPSRITGPGGFERRFELQDGLVMAVQDADGVSVRYERDGDGQVVAAHDGEGGITRLSYAPCGELVQRISPLGSLERWELDRERVVAHVSPEGVRTEVERSDAGRPVRVADANGATSIEWGTDGQPGAITDPSGATYLLSWDSLGRCTQSTLPGGGQWDFDYDEVGQLSAWCDPLGSRWSLGQHVDATGRSAHITDPLGGQVLIHDDPDRTRRVIESAAGRRSELQLDAVGNLVGGVGPDGTTCAVERDGYGRMVSFAVDGQRQASLTYTPGGRLASATRADGSVTTWSYDRAGRPVSVQGPAGTMTTAFDLDGRPVAVQGPGVERCELSWDRDGRPVAIREGEVARTLQWDAAGLVAEEEPAPGQRCRYTYDSRGLLVQAVGPDGETTKFGYNERGALVSIVDPEGALWSTERDVTDRVVATVDPSGRRTEYAYDADGALVRASSPGGDDYRLVRDADGLVTEVDLGDRTVLRAERSASERRVRWYDEAGRVTDVRRDGLDRLLEYTTAEGTTTWAWTDTERRVVVSSSGVPDLVADLDPDGLISRLVVDGVADEIVVERDGAGLVTAVTCGDLHRRWERDQAGQVTAYEEQLDGAVRWSRIERGAGGRIVAEQTERGEHRYRYDPSGQLTGADTPDGSWTWTYDRSGRLLSERGPAGDRQFSYDQSDQLVAVEGSDGQEQYTYDRYGRRIRRETAGRATTYEWGALGQLAAIADQAADGTASGTTILTDGLGLLSEVDGAPAGSIPGGPPGELAVRSASGWTIQAGGGPILAGGPDGPPTLLSTDWQGTPGVRDPWGGPAGKEVTGWLGETEIDGLVWLRHRPYDPSTHAFLAKDPLAGSVAMPGGVTNPYLYGFNDPLLWRDPLGLKPVTAAQASAQMQSWKKGHLGELLTIGACVVGTALLFVPGVDIVDIAVMGAGLALGSGGTVLNDELYNHGSIDWWAVATNGSIGMFTAGLASGPLAASENLPLAARIGIGVAVNGGLGAASGDVSNLATGAGPNTVQSNLTDFGLAAPLGLIPGMKGDDFLSGPDKGMVGYFNKGDIPLTPDLQQAQKSAEFAAKAFNFKAALPATIASGLAPGALPAGAAGGPSVPAGTGSPVYLPVPGRTINYCTLPTLATG